MELITLSNAVITALVIGLTQIGKGFIPERFVTLLPLALGVVAVGVTAGFSATAVLTGLIIGLAAQGLYDHKQLISS